MENNFFSLISDRQLEKIYKGLDTILEQVLSEKAKQSRKLSDTWFDNQDVMDLLKISPRTLQNMRDSKTLPFSKVGGKIYYKASDVEGLLEGGYHD